MPLVGSIHGSAQKSSAVSADPGEEGSRVLTVAFASSAGVSGALAGTGPIRQVGSVLPAIDLAVLSAVPRALADADACRAAAVGATADAQAQICASRTVTIGVPAYEQPKTNIVLTSSLSDAGANIIVTARSTGTAAGARIDSRYIRRALHPPFSTRKLQASCVSSQSRGLTATGASPAAPQPGEPVPQV